MLKGGGVPTMLNFILFNPLHTYTLPDAVLIFIASILISFLFVRLSIKKHKRISTSLTSLKDIDLEKLLGREPIELDFKGIREFLKDTKILVTGAGGSIGSELCRQIAKYGPNELLLLDIYENTVYDLENELIRKYPWLKVKILIASIRDRKRLDRLFNEYKPDIIFHAAAHKHVPLMEDHPTEAVKNNILGTLNLVECAHKHSVKNFVLISTDKAVNPSNIMGATKRVCEMLIQAMNAVSNTKYVAVRFGNVLGSNGSVIPLFLNQIADGGPVTVTDKYVTRYFMLISEATQLVIQAGAFAKGGEIFVLDMGEPLKIYDLAHALIKMTGLKPKEDIEIHITGLRPGEKLHEELFMDGEALFRTTNNKIFVGNPQNINFQDLKQKISELEKVVWEDNDSKVIEKLSEIVPNYRNLDK